jgi:hypothetical protein
MQQWWREGREDKLVVAYPRYYTIAGVDPELFAVTTSPSSCRRLTREVLCGSGTGLLSRYDWRVSAGLSCDSFQNLV